MSGPYGLYPDSEDCHCHYVRNIMSRRKISKHAAAVITGAGSGIGRSFAYEVARRGGAVICADISLEGAEETASMLRAIGSRATAYQCDVSQAAQVKELSAQSAELLGQPANLIINNAGVGLGGRIDETSLEDWAWCMGINLWGVIHGCHYFAPLLKAQGHGGIINVASAAGFSAAPEMAAYNVTKAGVVALSETLAAELRGDGIRVNVLCPTFVPTNIINNGRLPDRMSGMANQLMTSFAFTSSDHVARLSLDRLDKGELYTVPQLDAKFMWAVKRMMPTSYARGMSIIYDRVVD